MNAYITATGRFLPGDAVTNDEIEDYIGKAGRASSDPKDLILANCAIKTRHYAIDKNQRTVISNAAMAAGAVRNAVERAELELLTAATTMPDVLVPGTPAWCTASWAMARWRSPPHTASAVPG